jgi:hypothetical protein
MVTRGDGCLAAVCFSHPRVLQHETDGRFFCLRAFNGTNSAGVRCPWRFGNLNDNANYGLACENGNNTPGNSNWNGRPRLYENKGTHSFRLVRSEIMLQSPRYENPQ